MSFIPLTFAGCFWLSGLSESCACATLMHPETSSSPSRIVIQKNATQRDRARRKIKRPLPLQYKPILAILDVSDTTLTVFCTEGLRFCVSSAERRTRSRIDGLALLDLVRPPGLAANALARRSHQASLAGHGDKVPPSHPTQLPQALWIDMLLLSRPSLVFLLVEISVGCLPFIVLYLQRVPQLFRSPLSFFQPYPRFLSCHFLSPFFEPFSSLPTALIHDLRHNRQTLTSTLS